MVEKQRDLMILQGLALIKEYIFGEKSLTEEEMEILNTSFAIAFEVKDSSNMSVDEALKIKEVLDELMNEYKSTMLVNGGIVH